MSITDKLAGIKVGIEDSDLMCDCSASACYYAHKDAKQMVAALEAVLDACNLAGSLQRSTVPTRTIRAAIEREL